MEEVKEPSQEMLALQTLVRAAQIYVEGLDDLAKSPVSVHINNCVTILVAALNRQTEAKTKASTKNQ